MDPMEYDEEQDIVGTLDVIGKAWIPPRPVTNGRQSLPAVLTSNEMSTDQSTSSIASNRRSLSPSRLLKRASGGSISLLSDVSMQHSKLKARAATAERALIEQNASHAAALHKATERIKALELEREKVRLELDGWKAEAERFEGEASGAAAVSVLETSLAEEQRKKRRLKDENKRLNIELRSRREREKWDLAIYDADDRKLMNDMTYLEMQVAQLEGWLEIRQLDLEAAQEQLATASSADIKNKALSSTCRELEDTVESLRAELKAVQNSKDNDKLKKDLERTQTKNSTLAAEVEKLRKRVAELESRDEESSAQHELESQVKDLKTKLKTAQTDLKARDKALAKAEAEADDAKNALEKARQKAKEKKEQRARAASSSVPPSENEMASSPKVARTKPKAKPKTAPQKVATSDSNAESDVDETTSTVRPTVKATSNKRKADDVVLSDKSNNSQTGAAKAKAGKDKAAEPAKKKMRMLGGATRKFEWGATGVENANVNTLGIPMDLSPIKAKSGGPGGMLAGLLSTTAKAKSLFG